MASFLSIRIYTRMPSSVAFAYLSAPAAIFPGRPPWRYLWSGHFYWVDDRRHSLWFSAFIFTWNGSLKVPIICHTGYAHYFLNEMVYWTATSIVSDVDSWDINYLRVIRLRKNIIKSFNFLSMFSKIFQYILSICHRIICYMLSPDFFKLIKQLYNAQMAAHYRLIRRRRRKKYFYINRLKNIIYLYQIHMLDTNNVETRVI